MTNVAYGVECNNTIFPNKRNKQYDSNKDLGNALYNN